MADIAPLRGYRYNHDVVPDLAAVVFSALTAEGIDCIVVAPSLVPTRSGDRVKTDRRDAVRLARFLRSGDLTEVHVPDEATEAMRDLERARDDAKKAERVARHQLGKFLLRYERRYSGKTSWTVKHLEWIRAQHFAHEAQQRVLEDYLRAVEDLGERVERLTKSIVELVEMWSLRPLVKALQALRGISVISATVIAAELGDLARFESAPKLMGYLGLVPSEHSSGEGRRQGRITRAGGTLYLSWRITESVDGKDQFDVRGRRYACFPVQLVIDALAEMQLLGTEERTSRSSGKRIAIVVARKTTEET
mgnify:CR=1 FL=1